MSQTIPEPANANGSLDTNVGQPSLRARARARDQGLLNRGLHELSRYGLLVVLVVVIVVFSLWTSEFFTWTNIRGVLEQNAIIVSVALGAMLPLIAGEFDLSVGAIAGLASVFTVGFGLNQGLSTPLAVICAVLAAATIGLINALVVVKLKVNSFVTTLGTSTLIAGILQLYTGGQDLDSATTGLTNVGRVEVVGLPLSVVVVIGLALALLIITQKLPVGRQLSAVGANRKAAELSGIRPSRKLIVAFVLGATVAGIGGAFYGAQLGSAALATGPTLLLPAFAGAFLGATAITPGRFNVIGTIVAVLVLAFAVQGLEEVGVSSAVQYLVQGGALIVAVAFSEWALNLRRSRLRSAQLQMLIHETEAQPQADDYERGA